MNMSIVKHLDTEDFYQLMQEGLKEEALSTEQILYWLITYECGLFADDELILKDIMEIIERHR